MQKPHFLLTLILLISLSISAQTYNSLTEEELKYDSSIVNRIADLVISNLDSIKAEYYKIEAFKNYPFQTASLVILSNVMLNQQRFGNNKSAQNGLIDSSKIEAVYRTKKQKIGKYNFYLYGAYTDSLNFITINRNQLESIFQLQVSSDLLSEKEKLLDELVKYSKEDDFYLTENKVAGFNELGLMQREIMSIPILTKKNYDSLYNITSIITTDLTKLVNENSAKLSEAEGSLLFDHKQLADAVTNKLIELGYIKIPAPRNFNYIVLE